MKIRIKNYYSYKNHSVIQDEQLLLRNKQRQDYANRLCSTTHDYISRNGNVIMLLFTYNDENLPCYKLPSGEEVVCFSRQNIRDFLNRLKVNTYRYNRCDYKYFLAMEYGGNSTRRPHIHAMFFLPKNCDLRKFIDTCREQWTYGFTFPSKVGNPYEAAKLRSYDKGASYASKYVCKDLSYYRLPSVMRLLDYKNSLTDEDQIKEINDCLPRIYQSNGIGASLLSQINGNLATLSESGIINPLTKKNITIPSYVINKYLYKNVLAFDERKGKNGKQLYDRVLKVDTSELVDYKLMQLKKDVKRSEFLFLGYYDNVESFPKKLFKRLSGNLKKSLQINDNYTIAYIFSVYKNYSSTYSTNMLEFIEDFSDLFSLKNVQLFIEYQANTYERFLMGTNLRPSSIKNYFVSSEQQSIIQTLDAIVELSENFFTNLNVNKVKELEKQFKLKQKLMKLKYDKNLC